MKANIYIIYRERKRDAYFMSLCLILFVKKSSSRIAPGSGLLLFHDMRHSSAQHCVVASLLRANLVCLSLK